MHRGINIVCSPTGFLYRLKILDEQISIIHTTKKHAFVYHANTFCPASIPLPEPQAVICFPVPLSTENWTSAIHSLLHCPLHSPNHQTRHQDGYEEDREVCWAQPWDPCGWRYRAHRGRLTVQHLSKARSFNCPAWVMPSCILIHCVHKWEQSNF